MLVNDLFTMLTFRPCQTIVARGQAKERQGNQALSTKQIETKKKKSSIVRLQPNATTRPRRIKKISLCMVLTPLQAA